MGRNEHVPQASVPQLAAILQSAVDAIISMATRQAYREHQSRDTNGVRVFRRRVTRGS
jgi:hypothetical protein